LQGDTGVLNVRVIASDASEPAPLDCDLTSDSSDTPVLIGGPRI
jgi:hypothetical protein